MPRVNESHARRVFRPQTAWTCVRLWTYPPADDSQSLERPLLMRIDSGNEPPRAPLAPPGLETPMQRVGRYLFALALLGTVGGVAGGVLFDATQCSGADFDGECDLVGLAAIRYALIAVAIGAVLIVLVETARVFRRR